MAAKKTSVDAGPETSAPKSLGELIKEKRLAKGLSQKEVAERLGYASAQYVSDWERGYSAIPTSKLVKVAKVLEIPQDVLFEMLLDFSIARLTDSLRSEYRSLKKHKLAP